MPRLFHFSETETKKGTNNLWLKFKVDIDCPRLGSIQVESKFPQLSATSVRDKPTNLEISTLVNGTLEWASQFFDMTELESKYRKLASTTVTASFMTTPRHYPTFGPNSYLRSYFYFWIWVFDDVFDTTYLCEEPQDISLSCVTKLIQFLEGIIDGKYDNLQLFNNEHEVENAFPRSHDHPLITPLCAAFLDIRKTGLKCVPEYSLNSQLGFRKEIMSYLGSLQWRQATTLNGLYSVETYTRYRNFDVGGKVALEFIALSIGLNLPKTIRNHPIFGVFMDLVSLHVALANDILGAKKDLLKEDFVGIVSFKIFQKGCAPHSAITDTVGTLVENMSQVLLIKNEMLKIFPGCKKLKNFIDLVDTFIDGSNKLYMLAPRYLMQDCIKIE